MIYYILPIVLALLPPEDSFAARIYRCNGQTQDRPCTVRVSPMRAQYAPPRVVVARKIDTQKDAAGYARVLEQSFKRINSIDGLWIGRVEGNGRINLELHILRNGTLESRRYMGNVDLINTSSGFRFRSVVPKGMGWSWRVVAFTS